MSRDPSWSEIRDWAEQEIKDLHEALENTELPIKHIRLIQCRIGFCRSLLELENKPGDVRAVMRGDPIKH